MLNSCSEPPSRLSWEVLSASYSEGTEPRECPELNVDERGLWSQAAPVRSLPPVFTALVLLSYLFTPPEPRLSCL